MLARPGIQRPGQRGVEHAQHQVGPPVLREVQFEAGRARIDQHGDRRQGPRAARSAKRPDRAHRHAHEQERSAPDGGKQDKAGEVGGAHVSSPSPALGGRARVTGKSTARTLQAMAAACHPLLARGPRRDYARAHACRHATRFPCRRAGRAARPRSPAGVCGARRRKRAPRGGVARTRRARAATASPCGCPTFRPGWPCFSPAPGWARSRCR